MTRTGTSDQSGEHTHAQHKDRSPGEEAERAGVDIGESAPARPQPGTEGPPPLGSFLRLSGEDAEGQRPHCSVDGTCD